MIKFDVRNHPTGKVRFIADIDCDESELRSIKLGLAVKWAVENKADLGGAILAGADLRWVDLQGADLRWVDLQGADLLGANLLGANLLGANLLGANLNRADLGESNLYRARGILRIGPSLTGRDWYVTVRDGEPWIMAGCRYFTLDDARKHWCETRPDGPIGRERQAFCDLIEAWAEEQGDGDPLGDEQLSNDLTRAHAALEGGT